MRRSLVAAGLSALLAGCHPQASRLIVETVSLPLGESEVSLAVLSTGRAGPAFLVLHEDEETAAQAGLEAIQARGGRLIEVRERGKRLVEFAWNGERWRFDPNRVFTEIGAEATLLEHSGSAPPDVLAAVRRFAEEVLRVYEAASAGLVVTLHNNTDGRYSALSYTPGNDLAGDAADVHLPPGTDPDDFFFVTERWLYDALVPEGFPVVLQDNERVTDDGSLSVWAGRRGIPYVNVEAQHGNRERQIEMLEALATAVE